MTKKYSLHSAFSAVTENTIFIFSRHEPGD
jgi:hypothetical protein